MSKSASCAQTMSFNEKITTALNDKNLLEYFNILHQSALISLVPLTSYKLIYPLANVSLHHSNSVNVKPC